MKEHSFSLTLPWKRRMWSIAEDGLVTCRPKFVAFWSFMGTGFKFRCGWTNG